MLWFDAITLEDPVSLVLTREWCETCGGGQRSPDTRGVTHGTVLGLLALTLAHIDFDTTVKVKRAGVLINQDRLGANLGKRRDARHSLELEGTALSTSGLGRNPPRKSKECGYLGLTDWLPNEHGA